MVIACWPRLCLGCVALSWLKGLRNDVIDMRWLSFCLMPLVNSVREELDPASRLEMSHDTLRSRELLKRSVQELLESLRRSVEVDRASLRSLSTLQHLVWNGSEPLEVGKGHEEAKYDFKGSTGDLEGLNDIVHSVEDATLDAGKKAKTVAWLLQRAREAIRVMFEA